LKSGIWKACRPARITYAAKTAQNRNYESRSPIHLHLTFVADLNELLGRTLVIVAHADDEAVACGALLQRIREPIVTICTDGAPRDEYFWRPYGSREAYARLRAHEAERALAAVGVHRPEFVPSMTPDAGFVDQELFRSVGAAMERLLEIAVRTRADAILTLAYEGGHPDHDTCNFLGHQLATALTLPAWEAPLYQRCSQTKLVTQHFLRESGEELHIDITGEELARKRTMWSAYASQRDVLATFDPRREVVRPMLNYDYSRPPHEGVLNYEAWGWPIRGSELCQRFMQYLNTERLTVVAREKSA
jgi:LmbE family N-acetylglucosaminyl deacetylase